MKQTKTKLLCLILTALMLLSGLTACGKDKEGKDSNLIKLGDYCLLYTSPSPRDYAESRMPSSA